MKRCQKCRVPKDEKEFSWRWNALGKRDDICKECRKVYNDQYFKGEARERHLEQVRERKQAAREYVLNYLATHPCETCGESDVRVLEFHHTGEKEKTVSHMVGEGYAIERIQAEIDKCTILRLLRTTNGVECLHREVRRRARVLSIFPNPASCLRLVSAILAEISEKWLTGRTYLNFEGAT